MTNLTDTTNPSTSVTTQMFRIYIKATPEAIWDAITSPDWNDKYGYHGRSEYELRPGGAFRTHANAEMKAFGAPDHVVDGEVIEVDPPRRLVQTWRFRFMPDQEAEGFTTVTWDIEPESDLLTRLTVTHDVTDAPIAAAMIIGSDRIGEGGGGWSWILSDLKTLLETGSSIDL